MRDGGLIGWRRATSTSTSGEEEEEEEEEDAIGVAAHNQKREGNMYTTDECLKWEKEEERRVEGEGEEVEVKSDGNGEGKGEKSRVQDEQRGTSSPYFLNEYTLP